MMVMATRANHGRTVNRRLEMHRVTRMLSVSIRMHHFFASARMGGMAMVFRVFRRTMSRLHHAQQLRGRAVQLLIQMTSLSIHSRFRLARIHLHHWIYRRARIHLHRRLYRRALRAIHHRRHRHWHHRICRRAPQAIHHRNPRATPQRIRRLVQMGTLQKVLYV